MAEPVVYTDRTGPIVHSVPVVPSDVLALPPTRAIYVGTPGNITLQHIDGTSVLFTAVVAGILPVAVVRVMATGTTAANLIALY